MMNPGSNLLQQALTMIQPQEFSHYKALRRVKNAQHREAVVYAPVAYIWGSPQPMSSARAAMNGLDATKDYSTFYASQSFASASKDGPADIIYHGGKWFQVVAVVSWLVQDGWDGVVAVELGPQQPPMEFEPDGD